MFKKVFGFCNDFLLHNGLEMLPLSFLDFLSIHADCFSDFLHFLFGHLSNCDDTWVIMYHDVAE